MTDFFPKGYEIPQETAENTQDTRKIHAKLTQEEANSADDMICDTCGAMALISNRTGQEYCSEFKSHLKVFGEIVKRSEREFLLSMPERD